MSTSDPLERGRDSFERRAWRDAYDHLATADGGTLGPDDLERLATAAYLVGREAENTQLWSRAYQGHLDHGAAERAVRCGFWLTFGLQLRGEVARAGGWSARTERLLGRDDGVEAAFLRVIAAYQHLDAGDAASARTLFDRVFAAGERSAPPDLVTLAGLGRGQALLALGEVDDGTAARRGHGLGHGGRGRTDRVGHRLLRRHPRVQGTCSTWLGPPSGPPPSDRWCDSQPDLVPYRGQCLVHRAQLQQAAGDWPEAAATADAACRRLADPPHPALGLAHYQQGELHRLRGAFDEAEASYRRANHAGYQPVPGLAVLGLARGDAGAAATTIRRALQEARRPTNDRPCWPRRWTSSVRPPTSPPPAVPPANWPPSPPTRRRRS